MEKAKSRKKKMVRRTKTTSVSSKPTTDEIRQRAYEIYLVQGAAGDALAHWLQAERELRGQAKQRGGS